MALENQPVILGIVPLSGVLGWLGFNHWALKVGEVWHEVGAGPDSNTGHIDAASDLRISNIAGEYMIRTNTGDRATSGAEPTPINYDLWLTHLPQVFLVAVAVALILLVARPGAWGLVGMLGLLAVWWVCRVKGPKLINTWQGREPSRSSILGTTRRTEEEIAQFDELFEIENPKYLGLSTNCQRYVMDLFAFLMEPPHGEKTGDLPPPQSIGSLLKGGPPLTPPSVLVLTSSGSAVEWRGDHMGEWEEVEVGGLHDGVSYWRQRHTVDGEGQYLYRAAGKWKVGPTLGGTAAALLAPSSSTPARPPTEGWSYDDSDKQEDVPDPSLRCLLRFIPADPRTRSSQRFNWKNWRFQDGGEWVEGGVSVECDRHSWRK